MEYLLKQELKPTDFVQCDRISFNEECALIVNKDWLS
jgi:hypothetical protein